MNFRKLTLLAALLGAAWAAHAAERFGFKGIELGSGIAAVANSPKYECRTASAPGADTICSLRPREKETIAGAPVRSLFFFYFDNRLTGITLHLEEKHFAQVVEALRGKYGPGRVQTETVRNLKDLAFENRTLTWRSAGESLTAQRYTGRLDLSAIRFSAEDLVRDIERRRADIARNPGKDL
ncbi:MAG TPA: hypothetical protein PLL19_07515 [Thiobacillaceae bacterium]|nr:hypothetical protein [Thiobacillaceae bacterium]